MRYANTYLSPLGKILIAADEIGITGLWFEDQKYFAACLDSDCEKTESPLFSMTKQWLDIYFQGKEPDFTPPLHFIGTSFQQQVWEILCAVRYGQTITYGEIAKLMAEKQGRVKMSAQAVGGAVGRNKISIIVPCHRVIGKNGNLTGYAGGIDKKIYLLKSEGSYKNEFYIPK